MLFRSMLMSGTLLLLPVLLGDELTLIIGIEGGGCILGTLVLGLRRYSVSLPSLLSDSSFGISANLSLPPTGCGDSMPTVGGGAGVCG